MNIVTLLNGEIEFISNYNELIALIEKHMGYDMSYVIKELSERANEVKNKNESDLLSYEFSLEESRNGYLELRDLLDSMMNVLESKKVSKVALYGLADNMAHVINKNI